MSFGNLENEINIRFCGLGGMGVILVSIILGKAAIYEGKNALQTQSYGSEQRGTKVRSDITISNNNSILYPVIDKFDYLIAFSQEAYNHYIKYIKEDGIIIINSDYISTINQNYKHIKIPAASIARKLGNSKVLNIIMLGLFIKISNIVSKESVIRAIKETISKNYVEINIQAFYEGYNFSNK